MSVLVQALETGDRTSQVSTRSTKPSPDTLTKLVKRLRALTLALLPVEVDASSINEPTSRVITPQVIEAYIAAAGDFTDALPYCLLRARAEFMWDANHDPADYGENVGRATACEVLARRIVHISPHERLRSIMSSRFQHRQIDGDESDMSSALEIAIDSHCAIFLSSNEAQDVVNALWTGHLIQRNDANHEIACKSSEIYHTLTLVNILSGVTWIPLGSMFRGSYQNIFRIVIWLFFLVVYSQAVREPLERLGDSHTALDVWEVILYTMSLAFTMEDVHKFYSLLRFSTIRAVSFWNVVAFITDSLLVAAFALRVFGLTFTGDDDGAIRLKSFQVLSFVAPFIWMKLVTVFDGYKYIGTMQICVARMLKESGIFFALLSVLGLGFAQGLYALDAADGATDDPSVVVNILVQALLQSPDYGKYASSPAGLILYYFWNTVTAIILLNVLISLFSSAYSEVIEDAEAQYLAFFASKTIDMIRAPDSFVYPAPFNLIETFFIVPFELFPGFSLSPKAYTKLNRFVMTILFIVPLTVIALYESSFANHKHYWMNNWLGGEDEGSDDYPETRDPEVDDSEGGLKISKVPFEDLIKKFPNTEKSSEAAIIQEIHQLKAQLARLAHKLEAV